MLLAVVFLRPLGLRLVLVLKADDFEENEKLSKMVEVLQTQNKVFLFDKQNEENVFKALETTKVFILFVKSNKVLKDSSLKNIFDRYIYFLVEKQKAKSSLIVVLDGVESKILPEDMILNNQAFDAQSISFFEDILHKVENEKRKTSCESAKIEKIELEDANPKRISQVDIQSVEPAELGNYDVRNISLSDENKIRWIFLSLKNGDFVSAQEFVTAQLEKDPNNSQLLLAQLMIDRNIKTEDEFFSNISNFNDRPTIDKILTYASKDFAENFVNKWQQLVISLENEDCFNTYLLYLAKFNTSNREKLVDSAEKMAVETMNEELIEKVLKCFDNKDTERFVNFYFALAQKSDKKEYYQKILELDQSHGQSNLMLLLQRFKTDEAKLNYRNKEEVEDVLKYLNEDSRTVFVSPVVDLILPVGFYDIEKACEQLDFYLSYISNETDLVKELKKIAGEFLNMGFFKHAEKYLSIAVSKVQHADLYWELIKAKARCKTEQDLILTNVKVTKFAEWESLLSLSNEKEAEYYAKVVSKINLYKGERKQPKEDTPDKVTLTSKLKDFINRNTKILTELQKQEYSTQVQYLLKQLTPFEKYLEEIKRIKEFDEYIDFLGKIERRLDALELSLGRSVNVLHLEKRSETKKIMRSEDNTADANKKLSNLKNDLMIKRFCYIFLELCPLLFISGLLVFLIVNPSEVYQHFDKIFFAVCAIISAVLASVNFVAYLFKKRKTTFKYLISNLAIVAIGFANLILYLATIIVAYS